jgi:hypothetical protein
LKLYSTQIYVDNGSSTLRTGMSCEAEILVAYYPAALYLPVQCIVRVGGQPTVYLQGKDGLEPRTIELGQDNGRMAHVLEGVQAGEEVSLTPPLSDGVDTQDDSMSEDAAQRIHSANGAHDEAPASQGSKPADATPRAPDGAMRERLKSMPPAQREAFRSKKREGGAASSAASREH